MLIFNFPTLTTEPIELDLEDFTPAPDDSVDGFPAFWFGTALVVLPQYKNSPCAVCILSNYDKEEEEWQTVHRGTCTAETFEALEEHYYNNI